MERDDSTLIDAEEIRVTAELAALELDAESAAALVDGLAVLLEHFAAIAEVGSPESVPASPTDNPVDLVSLREDRVEDAKKASLHAAAPDFEEGFFFVPRVLA